MTPRRGKAVELNALWINGLVRARGAAGDGRAADRRPAARVRGGRVGLPAAVPRAIRLAPRRDRLPRPPGTNGDDDSLRPNQLLAYGLPYAPLRGGDPEAVTAVGARTAHAAGPAHPRRRRARLPGRPPRRPGRSGPGVPPGHGLAVADRAVRGRRPRLSACPRTRSATACSRAWWRTSATGASAPSARPRTGMLRTGPPGARSRPGRWRRRCVRSV